jgi:hypothetical protein
LIHRQQFIVPLVRIDLRIRCGSATASTPRAKSSLKTGTIFEDSPLGLDKWLAAVWLVANCRNGVSSYEVSRDFGVTQKSAWFMGHRIRLALHAGSGAQHAIDRAHSHTVESVQ